MCPIEFIATQLHARNSGLPSKLDAAYSGFSQAIDPVIAQSAKEQGFSALMNSEIAASGGLVIYADLDATNLTEDVKTKLQPK